jgi:Holliday junction resolvase RusA-like endonuclease
VELCRHSVHDRTNETTSFSQRTYTTWILKVAHIVKEASLNASIHGQLSMLSKVYVLGGRSRELDESAELALRATLKWRPL